MIALAEVQPGLASDSSSSIRSVAALQNKNTVVFYTDCRRSPRVKDVLILPVGSTTATYLIVQDGSLDIAGGDLSFENGKWSAGEFEAGAKEQAEQRRAALSLMKQRFRLVSTDQLAVLLESAPDRSC